MRKRILLVLTLVAIVATGCLGRGTPTSAPETKEAQTVPTATPVQEAAQPTPTPQPSNTPESTETPSPSITPTPEPTTAAAEPESPEASKVDTSSSTAPDLVGAIWQWTELHNPDGQSAIANPENYVLVFYPDGTLTLKVDCNSGRGTYTLDGNRMTFGPIALTKMLCPPGSLHDPFLQWLGRVETFAVQDGKLILNLKDEAGKLVFGCAGIPKIGWPPGSPKPWIPGGMIGIIWQWTEIHEPDGQSAVAHPEKYTLVFHPDGTFTLKADCNSGSGTYTVEGDRLTLELQALTEAYCGPESLHDVYLAMLDAVNRLSIENGRLILTLKDGAGKMVFDNCGIAKVPSHPDWIVGLLWKWERFTDPSGKNDIVVDDPLKYTLQLLHDGTFRFKADCNVGSGTYTLSGSSMTLKLGAATLAECGPDSLYDEYLAYLGDVVSYALNGGKLVLNLKAGAGSMILAQDGKFGPRLGLDPNRVTLDTTGLPCTWQANLVPAKPYDASQPPGPMGLPEHIQVILNGATPTDKQPSAPVIYIIPVEAYKTLWEASGDPGVSVAIEALQAMLQDRPAPFPTAGIPVLPFEEIGGTNDLAVQGKFIDLGLVSGLRFVGRFAQSPTPVTNEGLRYMALGFAGDANEYLVAFFYPVTTAVLPDSATDAPAAELERLQAEPEAYLEGKAETLNGLSDTDWTPNPAILDAVISSLRF